MTVLPGTAFFKDFVDPNDYLVKPDGDVILNAYRVGMGSVKPEGWRIRGLSVEAAQTKGPLNGVKAYQGPGGSGEKLVIHLLGR